MIRGHRERGAVIASQWRSCTSMSDKEEKDKEKDKEKGKEKVDYSDYEIRRYNTCWLFNIVHKGETGFIERFGKMNRVVDPGLHLHCHLLKV